MSQTFHGSFVAMVTPFRNGKVDGAKLKELVKTGKLPAMRTKVGKRQCWKIDVSTAERDPQGDMFEQKITARSGGS